MEKSSVIVELDDPRWRRGEINVASVERWMRPMTWEQRVRAIDGLVMRLAKVSLATKDHMNDLAKWATMVIAVTLGRLPDDEIESYAQAVIYLCGDEARRRRGMAWIRLNTGDDGIRASRLREYPGLTLIALAEGSPAARQAHHKAIIPLLDAMPVDDLWNLNTRIVWRLYDKFLHGNFVFRHADDAKLRDQIRDAARTITDADLMRLLEERGWQPRLTAGWLIALTRRTAFVDVIGELLLAGKQGFVGQGYCAALALIDGAKARKHLDDFLAKYLPISDWYAEQTWAIAAVTFLEGSMPQRFLDPALWSSAQVYRARLASEALRFREIVAYAMRHEMISG